MLHFRVEGGWQTELAPLLFDFRFQRFLYRQHFFLRVHGVGDKVEGLLERRGELYVFWTHGFPLSEVRKGEISVQGSIIDLNIRVELFVVVDTGNRAEKTVDFGMF